MICPVAVVIAMVPTVAFGLVLVGVNVSPSHKVNIKLKSLKLKPAMITLKINDLSFMTDQ